MHTKMASNTGVRGNFGAIMNAQIFGATHKEIVVAAFAASIATWEDFNAADWVRYKDVLTDEDLDAVRKIAVMLGMADALGVRHQNIVKDITCDILGDSVILKFVTDTDIKTTSKIDPYAAYVEIHFAKKYAQEFSRAFKKGLEIL